MGWRAARACGNEAFQYNAILKQVRRNSLAGAYLSGKSVGRHVGNC